MRTKPLLQYPSHQGFEELLNSCGSMTKQLEELGQILRVNLVFEGIEENYFRRYTILNLNEKSLVAACSSTKLENNFFTQLLMNANTVPIGKFLFANGSGVSRKQMQVNLVKRQQIKMPLIHKILSNQNYQNQQEFWQRFSIFEYQTETLELLEILLPEFDYFFSDLNQN